MVVKNLYLAVAYCIVGMSRSQTYKDSRDKSLKLEYYIYFLINFMSD